MRQFSLLAIVVLLALGGCCGVRFHDRSFSGDCPPEGAESMSCPPVGVALKAHGARLRGLWNHATHVPPAAPVPPPNPKYHPVPTRPVFAPLP